MRGSTRPHSTVAVLPPHSCLFGPHSLACALPSIPVPSFSLLRYYSPYREVIERGLLLADTEGRDFSVQLPQLLQQARQAAGLAAHKTAKAKKAA